MRYKRINKKFIWTFVTLTILILAAAVLRISSIPTIYFWIFTSILVLFYSSLFTKLGKTPFLISKFDFIVPKDYVEPLRISCAALVRILVHGKYFLIKKNTKSEKFQPIGGTYHFKKPIFREFGFEKDETGDIQDLKIEGSIKGLQDFIHWFDSKNYQDREINPHREIRDKLFASKIFDYEQFGEIKPKFVKRTYKNNSISYSKHYKKYELIIFEIFNLELSNHQIELFQQLMKTSSDKYVFIKRNDLECDEKERYLFADNVEYIFVE